MSVLAVNKETYLRNILNALPSAVFIIDHRYRILDLNPAAKNLFKIESDTSRQRLCGDVIHCLHAVESENGCGTTRFCPDCGIRNAVEAARNGETTHKKKYRLARIENNNTLEMHLLVSAAPFHDTDKKLVMVVIEDITEIIMLRRLLPICSHCKKIRNENEYWEAVTDYLKKHADLEFTHSICPDCARKLYPDLNIDLGLSNFSRSDAPKS